MLRTARPQSIYQFYLHLDRIEPAIWRRIQVPDRFTLKKLHRIIQIVMHWEDYHLHEFRIGERCYMARDPENEPDVIAEERIKLSALKLSAGQSLGYLYDFGDEWQHWLKLEEVIPPTPSLFYPVCIAGERNAPPEDAGGPFGYQHYLEALSDPRHEEHEEMLGWIGPFDPEQFSLARINQGLRQEFDVKKPKLRHRTAHR